MNHTTRTSDLKRMLNDRRRELRSSRIRVDGTRTVHASDLGEGPEGADASTIGDAEPNLVQASLRTAARIDDALARLDSGQYGSCLECARQISERWLSASPFAVRCQACEERRQHDLGQTQARH